MSNKVVYSKKISLYFAESKNTLKCDVLTIETKGDFLKKLKYNPSKTTQIQFKRCYESVRSFCNK